MTKLQMVRGMAVSAWLVVAAAVPALASCPSTPDTACKFAHAASLAYANSPDDTKDKLSFKLSKGANTTGGDFGDPTTSDDFDVCLYADGALAYGMHVAADGDCSDRSCWTMKTKGPLFKDKTGTPDGVTGMKLSAPADSTDDKTSVSVKGKGANLPDLSLPLAEPLAVQVRNSIGNCWGTVFEGSDQLAQDTVKGKIKAKRKDELLPSCTDARQNGFETALDCGGPCDGCAYGSACLVDADCETGICTAGTCSAKRVFVTSSTTNGGFGGLSGGDAICNARAAAGGLGGSWVAWLSVTGTKAIDRIVDQEYRGLDGFVVFASKSQISSTGIPSWGIQRDEFNHDQTAIYAWTGTNNNGNAITPNCSDWISSSSGAQGWVGSVATPISWSAYTSAFTCDSARHLICFEN